MADYDFRRYSERAIRANIPVRGADATTAHGWNTLALYKRPRLVLADYFDQYDPATDTRKRRNPRAEFSALDTPVKWTQDGFWADTSGGQLDVHLRYMCSSSNPGTRPQGEDDGATEYDTATLTVTATVGQYKDGGTGAPATVGTGEISNEEAFRDQKTILKGASAEGELTLDDIGRVNRRIITIDLNAFDESSPLVLKLETKVSGPVRYTGPGNSPSIFKAILVGVSAYHYRPVP